MSNCICLHLHRASLLVTMIKDLVTQLHGTTWGGRRKSQSFPFRQKMLWNCRRMGQVHLFWGKKGRCVHQNESQKQIQLNEKLYSLPKGRNLHILFSPCRWLILQPGRSLHPPPQGFPFHNLFKAVDLFQERFACYSIFILHLAQWQQSLFRGLFAVIRNDLEGYWEKEVQGLVLGDRKDVNTLCKEKNGCFRIPLNCR